ncbi:cytochrome c oxidase copper chaperone-like [Lepus europaeus]|uniref:cytochrome c oxidase copper chaperone-like n=1 Tax=Lepus europaeus TaxID=9983 RepID=UPI002B477189|nr:cytochrome c oxidase copper chaperone-like [Lepus europaeus]
MSTKRQTVHFLRRRKRKIPGLAATSPSLSKPQKEPLKPHCACPGTKKARDVCNEKREEHCGHPIEVHRERVGALGLNI